MEIVLNQAVAGNLDRLLAEALLEGSPQRSHLEEQTTKRDKNKSSPIRLGSDKIKIAALLLILCIFEDGFLYLCVFNLHNGIALITIGMMLYQEAPGCCAITLGDEPTRTFGDKPKKADLDDSRDSLKTTGNTPRAGVLDELSTIGCPGCNDGSRVPCGRKVGQDGSTVLWKGQLGKEQRGSYNSESKAETDDEPGNDELGNVLRGCL